MQGALTASSIEAHSGQVFAEWHCWVDRTPGNPTKPGRSPLALWRALARGIAAHRADPNRHEQHRDAHR